MKISSVEIKERFLNFFKKNNHTIIEGASVIPKNDPTLLYINAGMAAIKNYFTGDEKPISPRLCNVQPCIRTIDIDEIGDRHHLTSFQMLGSWSIGDYFKEKAIELAFDFLVNHLNVPVSKLYVSVFSGEKKIGLPFDLESKNAWLKVGIPEDHIVSFGMEDNFWGPASSTGPCGPCTEVFYDTGIGAEYTPGEIFDTKRYIEIWNAGVFMMLNKNSENSFSNLPFNSVDTGAGLERLTMILNGLSSVYDTDLLHPIKQFIEENFSFERDNEKKLRILTDHLRTICLILSEKQKISNEGRGYIPRKLIRKCVVIAHENTKNGNFDLSSIVEFILNKYKNTNLKFSKNKDYIMKAFKLEQNKFKSVIKLGFEKLKLLSDNKISGQFAFDLVTTFGMPFEVIKSYAWEKSLKIDEEEFNKLIKNHKQISKPCSLLNQSNKNEIFEKLSGIEKTKFVGYEKLEDKSKILKIFSEDFVEINSSSGHRNIYLILDSTPVYASSGGQESDTGLIFNDNFKSKLKFAIKSNGFVVHFCEIEIGEICSKDYVNIEVNLDRRKKTSNAHSATHLLQSALKQLFGAEVHQQGSKVEEDCLRFDFNYSEKISRDYIKKIEQIVNEYVRMNIKSETEEMSLNDAVKSGATAIFSEKYENFVRVVSFGDVSRELCGGTHVDRTGQIGIFTISSLESVGKGIKRINALTGEKALEYIQNIVDNAQNSAEILHVKIENLANEISSKIRDNKKLNIIKRIDKSNLTFLNSEIPFAYCIFDGEFSSGIVKDTANQISGIFVALNNNGRISLSICNNLNMNAKDILNNILINFGGKGGGNSKMASGGLKNVKIDEIIKYLKNEYEMKN